MYDQAETLSKCQGHVLIIMPKDRISRICKRGLNAKNHFKKLSWWDRWVILLNKLFETASQEKSSNNKKVGKFYIYKTKNSGFGHKMPF